MLGTFCNLCKTAVRLITERQRKKKRNYDVGLCDIKASRAPLLNVKSDDFCSGKTVT